MAPTIVAAPGFSAAKTAEGLYKAMKGLGTDEKAIIALLTTANNAQRVATVIEYKTMYGKDLIQNLKSELGGHFEDAVVGLMTPAALYDAQCLRAAMKGVGTDEETLIEILSTRNARQIEAIKQAYTAELHRDLEKDVASETSGKFKHILISLIQAHRDESTKVDFPRAIADAQKLHEAGEGSWFTDSSEFNRVFMTSSPAQLRAVAAEYGKISKYTLSKTVQKQLSGHMGDAISAILDSAMNTPAYFAERLYKAMKGAGTDDATLIRVIVSRCEVDMVEIKAEFLKEYGKSLGAWVASECSGDYKRLMLALIGEH